MRVIKIDGMAERIRYVCLLYTTSSPCLHLISSTMTCAKKHPIASPTMLLQTFLCSPHCHRRREQKDKGKEVVVNLYKPFKYKLLTFTNYNCDHPLTLTTATTHCPDHPLSFTSKFLTLLFTHFVSFSMLLFNIIENLIIIEVI